MHGRAGKVLELSAGVIAKLADRRRRRVYLSAKVKKIGYRVIELSATLNVAEIREPNAGINLEWMGGKIEDLPAPSPFCLSRGFCGLCILLVSLDATHKFALFDQLLNLVLSSFR